MILCGIICGVVCGAVCVLFSWVTTLCDKTFHANHWLIFILPAAGILVVLLYDKFRKGEDLCTDALFRYLHVDPVLNESSASRKTNLGPDQVSPWLAPLIFISTSLAYLFGGSVGRVGSALQLGGTLGIYSTGWIGASGDPAHDDHCGIFTKPGMRHVPLACGMAAGFCAILNAPVAGAIFGVEVLILSGSELIAIIPSAIASFITWGIAHLAQVPYTDFHFNLTGGITDAGSTSDSVAMAALKETGLASEVIIKVIIVAFAATLVGRMFCYGRTVTTRGFERIRIKGFSDIANKIVRVLVGTGLVLALTLIAGVSHYNGIGFNYVDATMGGESAMLAFLWKLALTLLTLGCGIRGGEIAPTIFIGATSCFTLGCLIGLDPTLAAAMGFVGALASVTNCPISIGILGLEAICFSGEAAIYFAITAFISHLFSGTYGLYHEQTSHHQILKIRIP